MKLLLAPVLVTATKPLTPSHIKGLLWLDLLHKATAYLHEVVYLSNRLSDDTTSQTINFWCYLDQKASLAGMDYSDKDDLFIAKQYLGFHTERYEAAPELIRQVRDRIERDHWLHGASRRLIEIWQEQYRLLGVRDPGLLAWHPFGMTEAEVIERLRRLGCLLDATALGGGVYLDFTEEGVPLRQIIDERGVSNYLIQTLRELLPLAPRFDQIVLGFDASARHDFHLVEKILALAGARVSSLSVSRVPLDGIVASTRLGGWADCTCGKILDRFSATHDLAAIRLGLRLYFVVHLGQEGRESFSFEALGRCMDRAEGVLGKIAPMHQEGDAAADTIRDFLRPLVKRDEVCVNPNRLLRAVVDAAPRSVAARTILRRLVCA